MIVFATKLPLKRTVDCKQIFDVIKEWLMQSPHYGINEINYGFEEELDINTSSNTVLKILNTSVKDIKVFAVRFENHEVKAVWRTDCVFNEKTNEFLIQLSCENKSYMTKLPKLHKPHIIKLLFEKNMVANTEIYPITDKPILLDDGQDVDKCAKIMLGESSTYLPVVYISCNTFFSFKYAIDPKVIAIKLAGIAHVLVEPNIEFSKKIKLLSGGNNAYNGFIGVYFPGTKYRDFISFNEFFNGDVIDKRAIADAVRYAVQQAALNHFNVNDLSWDKIVLENAKQKFLLQSHLTNDTKKEFDDYIKAFDIENERLKEKIESLTRQLDSKTAQLESYRTKDTQDMKIYMKCNIEEFYAHEFYDCVLNILLQAKSRFSAGTRPYEIVENILSVNNFSNHGKEIFKNLKKALGEKSLINRRKRLEECGFKVEVGPHDKITFHDNKYLFTLSNTPSDYRDVENMYKEIMARLDIYRKF